MARSFAALVHGYATFDPAVRIEQRSLRRRVARRHRNPGRTKLNLPLERVYRVVVPGSARVHQDAPGDEEVAAGAAHPERAFGRGAFVAGAVDEQRRQL